MKAISAYYTRTQYENRKKDITRRKRCDFKPGEHFMMAKQMQGLKKGSHREYLGENVCLINTRERVDAIVDTPIRKCGCMLEFLGARQCCRYRNPQVPSNCQNDANPSRTCVFADCPGIHEVDREGFPEKTPEEFGRMLMSINALTWWDFISRVVFSYVEKPPLKSYTSILEDSFR